MLEWDEGVRRGQVGWMGEWDEGERRRRVCMDAEVG